VIACEIRGTPYSAAFEKYFPDIQFLWLPKSSYDPNTVKEVDSWLHSGIRSGAGLIDVLLIDGDKSFYDKDFELYLPMMAPGGIVFFHDITDNPTGEAWRRIRDAHPEWKSFDLIDTTEALVMLNLEPTNNYETWLKHWHGRSCGVGCLFLNGK
jgi:hypothetical protein